MSCETDALLPLGPQKPPPGPLNLEQILQLEHDPYWTRVRRISAWSLLLLWLALLAGAVYVASTAPSCPQQQQLTLGEESSDSCKPRLLRRSINQQSGLRSKLSYVASLGVQAIWLSPVFKSPMVDFGYDISDFKDVDPLFGSLTDMKDLIKEMHELGLRLILDLVPNHSSDQHEWFVKSLKKEEPYSDYYIWAKAKNHVQVAVKGAKPEPPNNWISVFGGSAWTFSEERKEFYLHQFAKEQPDLNFRNQRVVLEMKEILKFWMKLGVDGFRIDALPHLFEDAQLRDEPLSDNQGAKPNEYDYLDHVHTHGLPQVFDVLREFKKTMDEYAEKTDKLPRLLLAEVYDTVESTMKYYGEPDQPLADFPFNFLFVNELEAHPKPSKLKELIDKWMLAMPADACPNWVLGNHDKSRVGTRIGERYIDSLNMVTLLLPGVAITYYGEEIGMEDVNLSWELTVDPAGRNAGPDNFVKASRDPSRTPMQWNIDRNAGFSEGTPTWLPLNQNYKNGINVEDQERGFSHLNIYRALIQMRKTSAFSLGGLQTVVLNDNKVFSMARIHAETGYLVAVNFSNETTTCDLSCFENVPEQLHVHLSNLPASGEAAVNTSSLELKPHQAVVLSFNLVV